MIGRGAIQGDATGRPRSRSSNLDHPERSFHAAEHSNPDRAVLGSLERSINSSILCPENRGRSHAVIAPTRENASEGVIHPSVCRGRPLSSAAIASNCFWLYTAKSVPLGKY